MKADIYTTYEDLLPSFYTDVFKDQKFLQQLLKSVDIIHMQSRTDYERNNAFLSVFEAEPLHTTITENIHLTKSERTSITYEASSSYSYGDAGLTYGQQATSSVYGIYDLGDVNIKSIGYISDQIENPSHIYTEGIDFFIDKGLVIFVESLETLFPSLYGEESASSDPSSDTLIPETGFRLVGYNVRRDHQDLNRQFGYVLGVGAPPTTAGRDVLAGLWKLHTFGPSWYWTMFTLSRALGADVIRTKEEAVTAVKSGTSYGNVVITQNNTYNVSGVPAAVGTVISYGYPATTDIDILHEFAGSFDAGIPGVVDLPDQNGTEIVQAYEAISNTDAGRIYLLPDNLILVNLSPSISSFETSKFTDIFEEVLPKNTRLIIIFGVEGVSADGASQGSNNDDPLSLKCNIMEATTTSRNTGKSKARTSIR